MHIIFIMIGLLLILMGILNIIVNFLISFVYLLLHALLGCLLIGLGSYILIHLSMGARRMFIRVKWKFPRLFVAYERYRLKRLKRRCRQAYRESKHNQVPLHG